MKKTYDEFSQARGALQSKLNTMLNSISDRTVSLSGEAHSGNICTVMINVSGIRGTMSRTVVMLRQDSNNNNDVHGSTWYCWMNGYKYELTSVTELKSIITQQVALMKPLVQFR